MTDSVKYLTGIRQALARAFPFGSTVGKRKAETSEASGGLERIVRLWLRAAKQRAEKPELRNNSFPFDPSLVAPQTQVKNLL